MCRRHRTAARWPPREVYAISGSVSEKPDRGIAAFVAERDLAQFHSPENVAKSIAIQAGELLECFR